MTLGQSIGAARKSAGISLDELATKTNIRPSMLREFEDNNFIHAGGDTYARGHLKTIARVLNINAEDLLNQFDEEHAQQQRKIHSQLVENSATIAISERKRLTNKQLMIYAILAMLGLIIVSIIVGNLKASSDGPKSKPTPTASATASPTPEASVSSEPNSYSSGSGVEVILQATNGASWLFVSDAAGITLYSGRAADGQTLIFSSTESVNLRIGNAGAVKLTVNGNELPSLGGDGEVVNVSYGVNS
jgi:cytoskeletal protein RodZ